jgi:N-acetylneuraminic acid mutarotase
MKEEARTCGIGGYADMGGPLNPDCVSYRSASRTFILAILETLDDRQIQVPFFKLCLAVLTLGFLCISANAQANEWVWMSGSSNLNQPGVYGTIGVPTAQNIPGSRMASSTWSDGSGNLWLFGGYGLDSKGQLAALNDLWSYSISSTPQNNQWTWVSGGNTVVCTPGLSNCVGLPGVYGTMGVSASGNTPGGRQGAATWTDASGNFWLFGGGGYDSISSPGILNDLWKFNPSTNQWTWIGGSKTNPYFNQITLSYGDGQPGVYGTLGTPAPGNFPGSRFYASTWIDSSGDLWLFGGQGIDNADQEGQLNDLWKYDPSTKMWAWMGGSSQISFCGGVVGACGQSGVYGTLGTPAAGNTPGGRSQAASWIDKSDNLWLFGGLGYDINGNAGSGLNDLWKFDPTAGQWAWMSGSSEVPCGNGPLNPGVKVCTAQPGVYGVLGVPAAGNVPAGGAPAAAWTDQQGNFWFFGGADLDLTKQTRSVINSLWAFNPSTKQWTWMGGDSATSNCSITISNPFFATTCDGSPGVMGIQYTAAPGNLPAARTNAPGWVDKSGNFWLFGGGATNLSDVEGQTNDLWKYQPSINTLPATAEPVFSLKSVTYVSGGQLIISNGMANASIYYTTDGTAPTTNSTLYSGPLVLSSSETLQALATAPGYVQSALTSTTYFFQSQPAAPVFSVAPGSYTSAQTVRISDSSPNTIIYYTTNATNPTSGSTSYTGPISVTSSETINAIAEWSGTGYSVYSGIAEKGSYYSDSAVASATYTINLPPPDFSISGTSISVVRGATTGNTSTISVTPSEGFTGNVSLTAAITSSPAGAQYLPTISFNATTPVSITSASAGTATLTAYTTAASYATLAYPERPGTAHPGASWYAAGGSALACILLIGIPARRRSWRTMLRMSALLVVLTSGVLSCGGGGSAGGAGGGTSIPGTTAGTYTITVTGTSGTTTASGAVTLTVQ